MPLLSARRAIERDRDVLARLCTEATSARGALWSIRRPPLDPAAWLAARAPVVVVAEDSNVIGFAAALPDNVPLGVPRCAEAIVYVSAAHRRRGGGRAAAAELVSTARQMGLWKLVAHGLAEDPAARGLLDRLDFREVGVLVKHAQLPDGWHDVALYERLVLAARKSMPSFSGA